MTIQRIQNGLVVLLTMAGLGLWMYTGLYSEGARPCLLYGAYYGILTLFLAWLYSIADYLQSIRFAPAAFLRRYGGGIVICLLLTVMIECSVKPSFKTLSDETNLMVTSRAMAFERTVDSVVMAVRYHGEFNNIPNTDTIDKRPFFYPFLEAVAHLLRGFGPSNAFLVNGILMFVFLSAVFISTRQFLSAPLSLSAVFLVISCPVFSNCGTSGGYDMLSTVYLGLSFAALYAFLRGPTSEKFGLLWMTLLALSQTRPESFLFFFIVLGFLTVMGSLPRAYLRDNRVLLAMTPLWLLLTVWGRLVNTQFTENPLEKHMFSFEHFQHNLLEFIKAQLNSKFYFPYNNFLNLLALVLLAYLFLKIVIQKRTFQAPHQLRFGLILLVCMLAAFIVPLSFSGGSAIHPSGIRHYLPISIMSALLPIIWLGTLSPEIIAKISTPFLLGSIGLFLLYHPIAVEGRSVNDSYPYRETSYEHEVIHKLFPDQRILIIAEIPSQFTALQYGAIDFLTANNNIPNFLAGLARHLYQDIVVIQKIEFATKAPVTLDILSPAYVLQTISEYETDPDSFIRISRVVLAH